MLRYTGAIEREMHRCTTRLRQLQEDRRKQERERAKALADDQKRKLQIQILEHKVNEAAAKAARAQSLAAKNHFVSSEKSHQPAAVSNQPPKGTLMAER